MKAIKSKIGRGKISNIGIAIMGAIILICSFPAYKSNTQPGLDASWQFAINYFWGKFKWGSQVDFPYGPLGFLGFPQNYGNNILLSNIFWMILFYLNIVGIIVVIRKNQREDSLFKVSGAMILFLFSVWILKQPEYYLVYITIIFVSITWFYKNKIPSWIIANIIFCISFYFKLSAAIIIGSVLFFMLVAFIIDKQRIKKLIAIFLLACVSIVLSLLIYTGSVNNTITYIKASLNISAGYNTAMSASTYDMLMPIAICIMIIYLILSTIIFRTRKNVGLYMFSFFGCIFFVFKHGFVRADTHVLLYFSFIALLLAIELLFVDFNCLKTELCSSIILRNYKKLIIVTVIFFIAMFGLFQNHNLLDLNMIKDKPRSIITYFEKSEILKSDNTVLDARILDEIGTKTVTVFPWEISYAAYNKLNYVPFPVFQMYSAYTPYLDKINAGFLLSKDAPQYILFQFGSIDGRHPLIDVPATWQAINNNYEAAMVYNGVALLKKTQEKYGSVTVIQKKETINKGQVIKIPSSENLVVAKIDIKLSFLGNLMKIFYKIPEVNVSFIGDKELLYKYRTIPESLENGLIVNKIPDGLVDALTLLNSGDSYQNIEKIQISGPGLKYYKKDITVKFYEIEKKTAMKYDAIKGDYLSKEVFYMKIVELMETTGGSIDKIGNSDLYPGLIQISGWANALGSSSDNQKVYLEVEDELCSIKHYYLARQTMRTDVSQYFNSPNYDNSGFDFQIDPMKLTLGEKHYGRVILENGGKFYKIGERQELKTEEISMDRNYMEEVTGIKYKNSEHIKGNIDIAVRNDLDLNTEIKVEGWAYIDNQDISGQKVFLQISDDKGNTKIYQTAAMERPDVGKAFGDSNLSKCGFSCKVDYSRFAGRPIKARIIVSKDKQYLMLNNDFNIK